MNNGKTAEFEVRLLDYSVNVIKLARNLSTDLPSSIIDQIIRSSTSIGANYAEAQDGSSKSDFKNKLYIAKKEANETKYWLRLIDRLKPNNGNVSKLIQETQELILIFQKIINTLNNK